MKQIIHGFFLLIFTFLFSACAQEKSRIEGKRLAILKHDINLIKDLQIRYRPISVPRAFANLNWPQTGGYPNHVMENLALSYPQNLHRIASVNIGAGETKFKRLLGEPIIVEGIVYTIDTDSQVTATSLSKASRIWKNQLKPSFENSYVMGGGLAYAEDILVATTGYGEIVALDPKKGEILWRYRTDSPIRIAPIIASGRIFTLTASNQTYALSLETGDLLWTHQGLSENSELLGGAVPAASNGLLFVPYSSGELFALSQENGIPIWHDNLAGRRYTDTLNSLADIVANLVAYEGHVFVSSHNGLFICIDMRTGKRLWTLPFATNYTPWIASHYFYVLSNQGELIAGDIHSGELIWVESLPIFKKEGDPESEKIEWMGPVMAGNLLWLVNSEREMIGLSPQNGSEHVRLKLKTEPAMPPIIADDHMILLNRNGSLDFYQGKAK